MYYWSIMHTSSELFIHLSTKSNTQWFSAPPLLFLLELSQDSLTHGLIHRPTHLFPQNPLKIIPKVLQIHPVYHPPAHPLMYAIISPGLRYYGTWGHWQRSWDIPRNREGSGDASHSSPEFRNSHRIGRIDCIVFLRKPGKIPWLRGSSHSTQKVTSILRLLIICRHQR